MVEKIIAELLTLLGEDPSREGLLKTPNRVSKALQFLTRGYNQRLEDVVNRALFEENHHDMVVVKNIDIFSLCEHHMLPFFGRCHVAYIPNGKILGLSKIPRLVDIYAKRLQVQERLTGQVAEALMEVLMPKGVGVVIEAQHLCMMMRGVEKQNSKAITSSMLGVFRSRIETRSEFLNLIK